MDHPWPLYHYFRLFKHTLQFFATYKCEKSPSSIRCWDSNSQPLQHDSPPITTRRAPFNFFVIIWQGLNRRDWVLLMGG